MNSIADFPKAVIGVVGLGVMGSSIVVALLCAGHKVVAIAPLDKEFDLAGDRILQQLLHAQQASIISDVEALRSKKLTVTQNYAELSACELVIECVLENIEIKSQVYQTISKYISNQAILATNTSAIPISDLQELVSIPERFLGLHFSEPAYMSMFLEITCGLLTEYKYVEQLKMMALQWSKEPTILTKDVRGFITNRLMYAVYREAFTLIEDGVISIGDADRCFRYDVGSWISIMGVFQYLELLGLKEQLSILSRMFPKLSNRADVPAIMQYIVAQEGRGVHNMQGLYNYTPESAKMWQDAFAHFNMKIFNLVQQFRNQSVSIITS